MTNIKEQLEAIDTRVKLAQTEYEKELQYLHKQKKELIKRQEEIDRQVFKPFAVEPNQIYHAISLHELHPIECFKYTHFDKDNTWFDNRNRDRFNMFQTMQSAENAVNKVIAFLKAQQVMDWINGSWKPDWSNMNESKYCLQYEYPSKRFIFQVHWSNQESLYNFKSREDCQKFVDTMGDDLKILYNIELDK